MSNLPFMPRAVRDSEECYQIEQMGKEMGSGSPIAQPDYHETETHITCDTDNCPSRARYIDFFI